MASSLRVTVVNVQSEKWVVCRGLGGWMGGWGVLWGVKTALEVLIVVAHLYGAAWRVFFSDSKGGRHRLVARR